MRIALVNWARVWEGAAHGGGVNGYTQSLALTLAERGHDVFTISGGNMHVKGSGAVTQEPLKLWRFRPWHGIRAFEFVNSPVLSPSLHQFRDPLGEVSAPDLEQAFADLLDEIRPDVVHFQNIEGFTIGCVDAALGRHTVPSRWPGAAVVFSLHNYHTICPQVYLMQGHRKPCRDYDNGHACVACIGSPKPHVWVARTMRDDPFSGRDGPFDPGPFPPPPLAARIRRRMARLGREIRQRFHPPISARQANDPAVERTPLTNDITLPRRSDKPPNDYAVRREAMVAMLNRCGAVLAVSDFVRDMFISLGVDPAVIRTMHIGSRITELNVPPRRRLPSYGPLRLAFMGYNNYYKGLPMLVEALELLPDDVLASIRMSVFALGATTIHRRFAVLRRRLGGLHVRDGYRFEDIPELVADQDLGLVTSVWWDNGPQTVFEFFGCGVPVIAANLGGIPDFVRHEHNGLLFRGNDRADLGRAITRAVMDRALVDRLRANVRMPKDMPAHADELTAVYAALLSSGPEDPVATRPAAIARCQPVVGPVGDRP
jgi:glycosyltransferase involved in cell wall biosynthesis